MEKVIIEIEVGKLRRRKKETLYDFYKNLQKRINKISGVEVISIESIMMKKILHK